MGGEGGGAQPTAHREDSHRTPTVTASRHRPSSLQTSWGCCEDSHTPGSGCIYSGLEPDIEASQGRAPSEGSNRGRTLALQLLADPGHPCLPWSVAPSFRPLPPLPPSSHDVSMSPHSILFCVCVCPDFPHLIKTHWNRVYPHPV